MAGTDIVGYTFQADNHCPPCAAQAVGWDGTGDPHAHIESAGQAKGIDVFNERSFDSGDWPKVIFNSQVEDSGERCGTCHELLIWWFECQCVRDWEI
jgi:hypothetical protein